MRGKFPKLLNIIALTLCLNVFQAEAEEVILTDSFEDGAEAPSGWRSGAQLDGVKYVYAKVGSDGSKSLSLQKSANRYFPIAQWFRTVEYKGDSPAIGVVAKVKASKVAKAIIDVQFMDKSGATISHEWVAYIGAQDGGSAVTHDWKDYGGRTKIPSGTEAIVVALQIYGPGSVWFDELELYTSDKAEGGITRPSTKIQVAESTPKSPVANDPVTSNPVTSNTVQMPQPESLKLSDGSWTRYITIPPLQSAPKPSAGYPVVLVLPGGTGSVDFFPFIARLHGQALEGKYIVAQLIAPPHIVWPTRTSQSRYASTENAIKAIVDDVAKNHDINRSQVYALAWSSSGPAIYEALLQEDTPLAGAFVAMSVFKPSDLPPLSRAAGKRVFLYHSPADQVCPHSMAKDALSKLEQAGVNVTLHEYDGGHGWVGPVYEDIRQGMLWLSGHNE